MKRRPAPSHPDLLSEVSHPDFEPPPRNGVGVGLNRAVLPVSLLVSSARLILERTLGLVWVSGEISNFIRAASGHCYFNLKDADAQVRCVFFRNKVQLTEFALGDGLQVEVRATASIYEARGEFQLNVDSVRLAGVGALYEKFARLKARLEAAGWFAEERKRPLPIFPRAVGVVTSMAAAALRDVLTTLQRRWPPLRVIVYPAAVQGAGAAQEIALAIRTAGTRAEVDVLVVCRGGGSIEDLWAFNEETVARAVFESPIPIVSGVGHETDFTICDFVADARAPTPTAAAARAAPDREAIIRALAAQAARWARSGGRMLEARMQRVDGAAQRLTHPAARLAQQERDAKIFATRLVLAARHQSTLRVQAVAGLRQRLALRLKAPPPQRARLGAARDAWQRTFRNQQQQRTARLENLEQNLVHLSPQAVLERGYAIVTAADHKIVQDSAQIAPGEAVALAFARGAASAKIETVER